MTNPEPKLSHMPPHIKQCILKHSDTETKFRQREMSRDIQFEVDKAPIRYSELKLIIRPESVQLFRIKNEEGEPNELLFKQRSRGGYRMKNEKEDYKKTVRFGDYREAAVERLLSVFKHSKVSVGMLKIEERDTRKTPANVIAVFEAFNRILSKKQFQLRVEKLTFTFNVDQRQVLSVLRHLQPSTLKSFEVKPIESYSNELAVDEIVLTEQWRQLKEVDIDAYCLDIPVEKYMHMENVRLRFSRRPTDTAKTILEKMLRNSTLKQCRLGSFWSTVRFDMTGAQEYLDRLEKIPGYYDYFKHPYAAGKMVLIDIRGNYIKVEM